MTGSIEKQAQLITKRHPFLANFPFKEFSMELDAGPRPLIFSLNDEFDMETSASPKLIRFTHDASNGAKVAIVIFEPELEWIRETADKIKDLDKIARVIDSAIESNDLLAKRDAAEAATVWYSQLEDDHTRLSYSTMTDILMSLIKNRDELVSIINKIADLSTRSGLVNFSKNEYRVVLTYYHFQLIYAKLVLGLVIASKISI